MAALAAASAAMLAAKGVPLRDPLKPWLPAEAHVSTLPCLSVMVTMVLLNVERICAIPTGTFFRSRRRSRVPFLGLAKLSTSLNRGKPPHEWHPYQVSAEPVPFYTVHAFRQPPRGAGSAGALLHADGAARALAGPGVGARPLPAHRKPPAVPEPPVAADVHEALDVHLHLAAQIALDHVLALNHLAKAVHLVLREVAHPGVRVDLGLREDLIGRRTADAVNVRQRHLNPLVTGQIDSGDSCQQPAPPISPALPLNLFVPGILADNHHFAMAANHFALLANALHRRPHFHRIQLPFTPPGSTHPKRLLRLISCGT